MDGWILFALTDGEPGMTNARDGAGVGEGIAVDICNPHGIIYVMQKSPAKMGRPRKYDEETSRVSFRFPKSLLKKLEQIGPSANQAAITLLESALYRKSKSE